MGEQGDDEDAAAAAVLMTCRGRTELRRCLMVTEMSFLFALTGGPRVNCETQGEEEEDGSWRTGAALLRTRWPRVSAQ